MEASEFPTSRLKREDIKPTKQDSEFSKWEILIGPSDWEDHSLGKEGTERYRIHNLPPSCTGTYELGIAVSHTDDGRKVHKLDPDRIVAVYVGQADNVKTRLQDYGRDGSHLDHGSCSYENGNSCVPKGAGFFKEIFSRGYPIVFRWARMDSKRDAKEKETQLLTEFDYAWNKGKNGNQRPDDILVYLDKQSSRTNPLGKKQVGNKGKKPLAEETESYNCDINIDDVRSRIIKIGRSQPRLVPSVSVSNNDPTTICGVILEDGFSCMEVPLHGRKRCEVHKGMRVPSVPVSSKTDFDTVSDRFEVCKDNSTICGVILGDGSICRRLPNEGRKRCEEHKGKKINGVTPKLETQGIPLICSPTEEKPSICGVILGDGSFCREIPVYGRKRCEVHKGMRATTTSPPSISKTNFGRVSDRFEVNEDNTTICGMILGNGSVCRRIPNEGRKRCEEHKGKRINGFTPKFEIQSESFVCGAGLQNGSVCRRAPAYGRQRCEMHKGRRAAY